MRPTPHRALKSSFRVVAIRGDPPPALTSKTDRESLAGSSAKRWKLSAAKTWRTGAASGNSRPSPQLPHDLSHRVAQHHPSPLVRFSCATSVALTTDVPSYRKAYLSQEVFGDSTGCQILSGRAQRGGQSYLSPPPCARHR